MRWVSWAAACNPSIAVQSCLHCTMQGDEAVMPDAKNLCCRKHGLKKPLEPFMARPHLQKVPKTIKTYGGKTQIQKAPKPPTAWPMYHGSVHTQAVFTLMCTFDPLQLLCHCCLMTFAARTATATSLLLRGRCRLLPLLLLLSVQTVSCVDASCRLSAASSLVLRSAVYQT